MILDTYGTHTHPDVRSWLARYPRFQRHVIPASSSWLNLAERWFRDLAGKALRRGAFKSVPDLTSASGVASAARMRRRPRLASWSNAWCSGRRM